MDKKIKTTKIHLIKDFLSNHSFRNPYMEICGLIGFDEKSQDFVAKIEENIASDPRNYFSISAAKYLNFKDSYKIAGIFHSHIIGDENPSEFDIKMSEACCVPFIIFSIKSKKFFIYEPSNSEYDVNILKEIKKKIL